MRTNQIRLWMSSFDDVLMCATRRMGLVGTKGEVLLAIGRLSICRFQSVNIHNLCL